MTKNIFGLTLTELKNELQPGGFPPFRAKQIVEWLYQKNTYDFAAMTNLPLPLRQQLTDLYTIETGDVIVKREAKDKRTTKMLLEFTDKAAVETVLMRQNYGNSICVSSQVGCNMGCTFCASTLNGLQRNLTTGEMLAQALKSQELVRKDNERINNIVIMGSGEPLLNYDNVLGFIRLVHEKYCMDIGYRNITLSTSGIIPMMRKLADEDLPITLSVSLHAPDDELRSQLMPVNKRYKLENVMKAADYYAEKTKRRITYEYILINELNDNIAQAHALADLLRNRLANLNIIPINPVKERNFDRPSPQRMKTFLAVLDKRHVNYTVRKEMGTDIDAACGQLRNAYLDAENE
ncbi:23S rRNA (adenine(2503)-C(2))-methyltransferase RlmN [Pectinatus sottacetonis]|uniref:23S rRNA (adenine(2503)-C(2))-methyltransferase RlmN n=1 Tax=Pectinatus sottacetonis TaxID=1002795 RepID=UPI0018C4BA65|nr:23S rRNA (adenine(2503)-C(2))-methyltransferase RlmN [Pectinatus sottacetonis]